MLFLFRSAPEVEKRIHSKLFRKFWRSRGTKEPAYITVDDVVVVVVQLNMKLLHISGLMLHNLGLLGDWQSSLYIGCCEIAARFIFPKHLNDTLFY